MRRITRYNAEGSVVVLTGASSGIGRATALALARKSARLILTARDATALDEVARECRALGAIAHVLPLDVADAQSVRSLADLAIEHFGRIDVWINNVGVGAVGRFEETPIEAHRRVIESNLIGHFNGAHAALAHFRQRHRGTLINMISLGGWIAAPYAAAYTASKFGLRGLGQSLRAELADEPDIHVCDVYPALVDTPAIMHHSGNYIGRRLRGFSPMLRPQTVAKRIVSLIERPRPTLVVGGVAYLARYTQSAAPELRTRYMRRLFDKAVARAPAVPPGAGNLFEASRIHAISGGQLRPMRTALLGLGAASLVGLALYSLARR